jgi:hypothetical protein
MKITLRELQGTSPGYYLLLAGLARDCAAGSWSGLVHGTPWPHRYRHEQSDRLGFAPCICRISGGGGIGCAECRLHGVSVWQNGIQTAGSPVRVAGHRAVTGWINGIDAGSGATRPVDRGHDTLQLQVHFCLKHLSLFGLHGVCRCLPVDHDGATHEPLHPAGGSVRLYLAHGADHGNRLDFWLSGSPTSL